MQKGQTDCYSQIKLQDVNSYFKKQRSSAFAGDIKIRILGKLEKISPKSTIQEHIQAYVQKKIDKEEFFNRIMKDTQAMNDLSTVGGSGSFKNDEVYGILSEDPYFVIVNFNDIVSRLSLIPGEYYYVFGDLNQVYFAWIFMDFANNF